MITGVAVAVITSPESVRTVAVTRIGPGPVPLLMETQASPYTRAHIWVDSKPPPPTTIISPGYEEGISI